MLKKSLFCALAIMVLSLCCGICCFAAENGNTINLGNEIMESIDKTKDSAKNVISGNVIKDTGNMVTNEMNNIKDETRNMGNTITNTFGDMTNNENNDNNNNKDAIGTNNGNYNTTRTSAEQTLNNGMNEMTVTTWMWIILIVAAVTIMFAIWYYATRNNDNS